MKTIQAIVPVIVLCVASVLVYQVFRTASLFLKVDDNTEKIGQHEQRLVTVEEQNVSQETKLTEHKEKIEEHSQSIRENLKEISDQKENLGKLATHLKKLETELEQMQNDSSTKKEAIEALRDQIQSFKKLYDQQAEENRKLKKDLEELIQKDAEVELRLRALEKLLQGKGPQPFMEFLEAQAES